jgi:hypothetical protein
MAGLVPAIHVLLTVAAQDVDARDKPGHDEGESGAMTFDDVRKLTLAWLDVDFDA